MARAGLAMVAAVTMVLAGCTAPEDEPSEGSPFPPPAPPPPADGLDGGDPTGGPGEGAGSGAGVPRPPPPPTTAPPPPQPGMAAPPHDTDRDGIRDDHERALAASCSVAGKPCVSLGLEPPKVGVRDYVLVQFGRSGGDRDWRLPEAVWQAFLREVASLGLGIHVQRADLGLRDDVQVPQTWEDPANEGRFWFTWLTYDPPRNAGLEGSGWNQQNWIMLMERDHEREQLNTLLHEVYHSMLGDLRHPSSCADPETGGPGHAADPESILYTSPACEQQGDSAKMRLGRSELQELADEPFENLRVLNEALATGA